jgi:hypothetical protein
MKRDEVFLDWEHRVIACREMGRALVYHGVELVDLCVCAAHYHLLARFTPVGSDQSPGIRIPGLPKGIQIPGVPKGIRIPGVPKGIEIPGVPEGKELDTFEMLKRVARHYVGIAKKNSSRALSDAGLVAPRGVWAVRGSIEPVKDRQHQLNVVRYIRNHAVRGAAVWSRLPELGNEDTEPS